MMQDIFNISNIICQVNGLRMLHGTCDRISEVTYGNYKCRIDILSVLVEVKCLKFLTEPFSFLHKL